MTQDNGGSPLVDQHGQYVYYLDQPTYGKSGAHLQINDGTTVLGINKFVGWVRLVALPKAGDHLERIFQVTHGTHTGLMITESAVLLHKVESLPIDREAPPAPPSLSAQGI